MNEIGSFTVGLKELMERHGVKSLAITGNLTSDRKLEFSECSIIYYPGTDEVGIKINQPHRPTHDELDDLFRMEGGVHN